MNSNATFQPWGLLKSLVISYAVTVILLAGLAFLMYQMKLGASQAEWGVTVICLFACALGGFLTGRRVGSRRLLWGMGSGALYFMVLLVLSLLVGGGIHGESSQIGTVLATCLAGGAVGAFIS